ncbi:MAG: MFS transporter [Dehalococcoidia bacterium]|nr:MFS transporter [Dehalococcoidia bacterium]
MPTSIFGRRIFYGWYIVAVAFFAAMMSSGVSAYSVGIFVTPMSDELGWSRTALSFGQTASTAGMGVAGLFIGGLLDRRGGRGLMVVGAVFAGAGYILLGQVQELWQYYAVQAGVVTLGMAGMGAMVTNVAVSNWFVRRRGQAIAISAMGISVTALVLPTVASWMIEEWGWRAAWAGIGVAIWVVVIPPSWVVMRRRPEDYGLEPDGGVAPVLDEQREAQRQELDGAIWTRREALRTPALWMLILSFGLGTMGFSALLLHLFPYLEDSGFSRTEAAGAVGMIGLAGLISKPFWGLLVERLRSRIAAAMEFLILGLGIGLILAANDLATTYGAIFLFGVGVGGIVTIQEVVWADYFGRLTLGAVRSIGRPFTIVSSAGGPVFAGVVYDVGGGYEFAFVTFIVTYVAAAVLILATREPTPPRTAPTQEGAA